MKDKLKKRLEVLEANAPKAKDHILYKLGFNDAIDKACKWLESDFEELTRLHLDDIVIDKFCKAMKGGKK